MKKLMVSLLVFSGFVFPMLAQIDHDYDPNDHVAIVNATITKDQVPAAVQKAVNTRFDKNNPVTWSKFPYNLKDYGWVYENSSSDKPLNHYQVSMKTNKGDNFLAIYDAEGNLLQTREMIKNAPLPAFVTQALAKSQYKDWKVLADKEIIKYYHIGDNTSVDQHLRVTVEKDKVKRSLSFNDHAGK